jgi:hypothetical protein
VKSHPQAGAEFFAPGAYQRRVQQDPEFDLYRDQKPRRRRFRGLGGDVGPDCRKVSLGRLGQAQGQRFANSFLPRSTI